MGQHHGGGQAAGENHPADPAAHPGRRAGNRGAARRRRRKYKTCETIQRYIAHIEQKAQETAAASSTAELNLRKLEAEVELKESQGQLHKLKTAIAEGKYIKAEEATRDLADFMAMFKKFAMNIPPRAVKSIAGYADPQTARAMERAMRKELEDMLAVFVDAAEIGPEEAEP